ncbi:hypothetical protein Q3G72_018344 [Acer saccharum]|nr:hypothetical protein Q3G72_018344 [Acer saccharum]
MGHKTSKQQDLFNLLGAMYSVIFFLGGGNANAVQPVVSVERTVFYRETEAGMYSALPYAFAQVAIEGSPVAWTLYGVMASQVGDKDTPLQMLGLANTDITISFDVLDPDMEEEGPAPAPATLSSPRSFASNSHRSWVAAASFREAWNAPSGVFNQSERQDDEEELRWAAIERLPKYDRLRKGVIRQVLDNGKVVHGEVDVTNLGMQDKKQLMESILKVVEEDNEKFLRRLRDRTDRVGIEVPKIEVRYEHLSVEGDVHVGSRALPSLINFYMNAIEVLKDNKKRKIQILNDVSGVVRPSRMTLLLGPSASGKTTLMLALAEKLGNDLRTSGKVTYCGHELTEFMPQRTCAYISQHDLHYGEMIVRDFSGRCLGVGARYELLAELSRREKEAGIKPDPEIDAFMKATVVAGQGTSLVTDYVLKKVKLSTKVYKRTYLNSSNIWVSNARTEKEFLTFCKK